MYKVHLNQIQVRSTITSRKEAEEEGSGNFMVARKREKKKIQTLNDNY